MTDVTTTLQAASRARRPKRADAQRNYDKLLAAASDAFTEDGPDASLEDIARRAGVGIGTLYRHFPTRHALLEAGGEEAITRAVEDSAGAWFVTGARTRNIDLVTPEAGDRVSSPARVSGSIS